MEITKKSRNNPAVKMPVVAELNVLIVDDHHIIREGLKMMLENISTVNYQVFTAGDLIEAKDILLYESIQIALVDYKIGKETGDKLISFIVTEYPSIKCIAISGYDESDYVFKMLSAGASAYILKNLAEEELNQCIAAVLNGENYYSKELISAYLLDSKKKPVAIKTVDHDDKLHLFSSREIEIIKLIALEMTNDEIGEFLNISSRTVGNHRTSILQKIRARNTVGLIRFALENKLID